MNAWWTRPVIPALACAALAVGCDRKAPADPAERQRDAQLKRLEARVGGTRELEAAPGGGVLGSGPELAAQVSTAPALDSATARAGGQAADDHRVLFCPIGSNAPLRDLWYVFSDRDIVGDQSCAAGDSRSWLWTVTDAPADGDCVVGWTGVVSGALDEPFAGVGAELGSRDLSGFSGVALRVRGDGTPVRFEVGYGPQLAQVDQNDCEDGDLDLHGITFDCGDGGEAWTALTLPFDAFRQQGWGKEAPQSWSQVDKVQLRVIGGPRLPDTTTPPRYPERQILGERTDGFTCDFEVVGFLPR